MATTVQGRRLTEQHSRAQHELAQRVIARTLFLWPLLDLSRLDATAPAWVQAMMDLVLARRADSSHLAAEYYREYRAAETGQGDVDLPVLPAVASARIATSLIVTGPNTVKRFTAQGVSPREAGLRARTLVANAAMRHTLDAGRDTIKLAVQSDPAALGFARVTDADPCWWCAMLASRGAVYKDSRTALLTESGDKYHDGCGCTVTAVYTRDEPLPGQEFARLWADSTRGLRGKEALRAFRAAYEQHRSK